MRELPFNRPHTTGRELEYVAEAIGAGHLSGNGPFSQRCCRWLEAKTGADARAADAFVHGGARDGRDPRRRRAGRRGDHAVVHLRLDRERLRAARRHARLRRHPAGHAQHRRPTQVEAAITAATKAIVPVHYAGVGCEHGRDRRASPRGTGCVLIEDAAQGLLATYRGRPLGGDRRASAALSFHETKNVISGEGGALLVNDARWSSAPRSSGRRARTGAASSADRSTSTPGSTSARRSCPSEIIAAFLWAQLEDAQAITERRLALWTRYHEALADARAQRARCAGRSSPPDRTHNAHMYYVLLPGLRGADAAHRAR